MKENLKKNFPKIKLTKWSKIYKIWIKIQKKMELQKDTTKV